MPEEQREDLAAMLAWIARRLGDAEGPLLAANGLTLWEYVVLSRLARGPAANQLTLARDVRHDKTRLIKLLDALRGRGLIERVPDPADRRSRNVTITGPGRKLHRSAQTAIREMEDEVLAVLGAGERRALLNALPKLYASDRGAAAS